jgi:hypothetical protein
LAEVDPADSGARRAMTADAQGGVHTRAAVDVRLRVLSGVILSYEARGEEQ